MAWLPGYTKRIKLTIDNTKIDADFSVNVKEQINTATYDNFGLIVKTGSDTIIYFTREGTSHVGDKGKIVKQVYTISTDSWGDRSTVYDDANDNYDSRNLGGGIIGNNIYIFFRRYNWSTSSGLDTGYIKSTDLTGSSWGSYVTLPASWSPYGHIIETATAGKYLQPFYGGNGSGTWWVKFYETVDSGDNWTLGDTLYSGATRYNETCVAYIGDNEMIALIRSHAGGHVKQSVSSDNGENWSAPTNTNLGASSSNKVSHIMFDSSTNKVIAIYQDRHSPYNLEISIADADTVHASPTSWGTPIVAKITSVNSGYPSMVKTGDNKYFFVSAYEKSASDCDTIGGYYSSHLNWFPVDVFFTAAQGEEIFTEFDADSDYKKCAFTKSDGLTQLYAHKILFDVSENKAIYRVSRDNWFILHSANTELYYYYNNSAPDNDTYIGVINTSVCEKVYNQYFKAVYPMEDGVDTSHIYDATSNNNDGTKKAANEPIEATGKVSKAQNFDGTDDYIDIGRITSLFDDSNPIATFEYICKPDAVATPDDSYVFFVEDYINHDNHIRSIFGNNQDRISLLVNSGAWDSNYAMVKSVATVLSNGTWYHVGIVLNLKTIADSLIYVNGASKAKTTHTAGTPPTVLPSLGSDLRISGVSAYNFDGILDEIRISTARTASWLKATYHTLHDDLLVYGSEENNSFEYTGTGTLAFSGSAIHILGFSYIAGGNLSFGGTATQSYTFDYSCTASGNLIFSGEAECYKEIGYIGSGSFAFSGTAIQSCTFNYSCTGSGNLNFSGEATCYSGNVCIGSGSISFSGEASCAIEFSYIGSGSLDFSGGAIYSYETEEINFVYSGTGNLTFSGVAIQTYTLNYVFSGTGTFTFSGSALISKYNFISTGSGTFTFSGIADHLYCYSYTKIEKDVSVYIKIDKEISNYKKVDRC